MTEKKFKSYEEMTQEERNEPNREVFTWKNQPDKVILTGK